MYSGCLFQSFAGGGKVGRKKSEVESWMIVFILIGGEMETSTKISIFCPKV